MTTVLVIGASGMLGGALCAQLKRRGHEAVGVSRSGKGGLSFDLSDPAQTKRLFENRPVSWVVNSAAYSDVDGCERDPQTAYASNASAVKNLSDICGAKKIPWIHVSTDYVFSGQKREPYVEKDRCFPVNNYGVTKWIGEFHALKSESPCTVVRTSWLFGARNPKNFVNFIGARVASEKTIRVLDDQTDAPTSVQDLSAALIAIGESLKKEKRPNEVFHVCNAGEATRLEMTRKICEFSGRSDVVVERTDPADIPNRVAIRPQYAVMSCARFEKTFGMKMRPWQESLREYVKECAF